MIPKIIHLCWFSGEEYPPFIKRCIDTWKEFLPDYKIKVWDSDSFDFDSVPFVREAYKARKWAFVADYIRLYALYMNAALPFNIYGINGDVDNIQRSLLQNP